MVMVIGGGSFFVLFLHKSNVNVILYSLPFFVLGCITTYCPQVGALTFKLGLETTITSDFIVADWLSRVRVNLLIFPKVIF